jgi:purine-binding chemotaxis protein CheW
MSEQKETETGHEGGKFLTFCLADEEYGVDIHQIKEILALVDITPVPRTPDFVKGVINLRGRIIPVIDLRVRFGMEEIEYTKETCIIVINIQRENSLVTMGVIVDRVSEVTDIEGGNISEVPGFGTSVDTEFMEGIGKVDDRIVLLLSIDRVMNDSEVSMIGGMSGSEAQDSEQ